MPKLIQRYGFAAAVVAGLALMAALALGKGLVGAAGEALASRGPAAAKMKGDAPEVRAAPVQIHTFSDAIQAIGNAQAKESILITPKSADAIRAIRFESGDRVSVGQVLVEMSRVEQQADIAEATASREAAEREYRRFQEVYDQGFAPKARLDAAKAAFDAADARLRAGQSRSSDRLLRAPFAGVMGLRTASPGQYVRPGDAIGTLDDISEIKLDFDVAETQIARLAPGVAISARTQAYPDVTFEGRISQVDSRVAAQSRTVRVRAVLPNPDERLRPGMLMSVEIRSNPRQALAIPEAAIIDEQGGSYVFTLTSREGRLVAARTPVRTAARVAGWIEVVDGLREGQQIVVEGVQRVRPDAPVRLANTPAGGAQLRQRGS
ncbi:MAG: efflux RND transporter periplasmic adaptor subunit [Hyphomonadaceae bacterium]|nr:efflux RND transporter periplasmic adaptor subunit [Hyphomonadaceae bacterium]